MKSTTIHTATLTFQHREQFRDTYTEVDRRGAFFHYSEAIFVKVPHGVTRGWRNSRNWPFGRKIKVTVEVVGK